jgi:hypothetical protein
MTIETITWRPVGAELPDADTNVLLAADEAGTFEGFLDGTDDAGEPIWRDVTALQVHGVTHWAEMPAGPQPSTVVGRIGRDPDLVTMANGRAVDLGGAWPRPA